MTIYHCLFRKFYLFEYVMYRQHRMTFVFFIRPLTFFSFLSVLTNNFRLSVWTHIRSQFLFKHFETRTYLDMLIDVKRHYCLEFSIFFSKYTTTYQTANVKLQPTSISPLVFVQLTCISDDLLLWEHLLLV